jgi:CRISPR-associated protein Cas8b1/Cst1 subtype I-B
MYNLSHIKCQEKNFLIGSLWEKAKKCAEKMKRNSEKNLRNITIGKKNLD